MYLKNKSKNASDFKPSNKNIYLDVWLCDLVAEVP